VRFFRILLTIAIVFLISMTAQGLTLFVTCGDFNAQYPSVTHAVSSLQFNAPDEPHFIIMSGTCNENVKVFNLRNITFIGDPNSPRTVVASNPDEPVFHLFSARGITFFNMRLQGGQGLMLNQSSEASFFSGAVDSSLGAGITVQMQSTLLAADSVITASGGDGIDVAGNSHLTVQNLQIANNSGFGINGDGSYIQANDGSLLVENNAGNAMFANGGRVVVFGGVRPGSANIFRNNGGGLTFRGATVNLNGQNYVQNNGTIGINAIGSTVTLNASRASGGTWFTTIEGHSTLGILADRLTNLTLNGAQVVQHNGSPTADPTSSGGIFVNMGAALLATGPTQIVGNTGFGIGADQLGIVTIDTVTIANNSREGVHLGHMSNGFIGGNTVFSANGNATVTCDKTSWAFADDLKSLRGHNCKNIDNKQ
jgi:Right handed beta helix region